MPLAEIYNLLKEDELRGSEADIFKRAIAGMVHLTNSYTDIKVKELMPDTASREGLERWANILGVNFESKTETEDLKRRVLKRLRMPPHGGSKSDFEDLIINARDKAKIGFCFPVTDPGKDDETAGNVTISALDEAYNVIENGEKIKNYVSKKAPLSINVHYKPLVVKEVRLEIYTFSKFNERQEWKEKVTNILTHFFNNHTPGGLTKDGRIYFSELYSLINKAGNKNYRIDVPTSDIKLERFEIPRLKGGKIIWKPSA